MKLWMPLSNQHGQLVECARPPKSRYDSRQIIAIRLVDNKQVCLNAEDVAPISCGRETPTELCNCFECREYYHHRPVRTIYADQ